MVRHDRDDPGTVMEFKRLDSPSLNAIRKQLWEAARQVNDWGGGDAVMDGRKVGLTEQLARQRLSEALAESHRKGKPLPARIHVILGDGSMITIQGRE